MITLVQFKKLKKLATKFNIPQKRILNRSKWYKQKKGGGFIRIGSKVSPGIHIDNNSIVIGSTIKVSSESFNKNSKISNSCIVDSVIEVRGYVNITESTLDRTFILRAHCSKIDNEDYDIFIVRSKLNNTTIKKLKCYIDDCIIVPKYIVRIYEINDEHIPPALHLDRINYCGMELRISYGYFHNHIPKVDNNRSFYHNMYLLGPNHVQIGCHIHTISTWKKNYKKIIQEEEIPSYHIDFYKNDFNYLMYTLNYYLKTGDIQKE